jgi:hypothetical protein
LRFKSFHLFFFVLFFLCSCNENENVNKKLVHESFERIRSASELRDGEAAYSVISSKTKDYYSNILNLAKYLPEEDVRKLSAILKIEVLKARHSIDNSLLSGMDGKSFFVHSVNEGLLVAVGPRAETTVTDIKDDFAVSCMVLENGKKVFDYIFRKEGDVWRIDLTSKYTSRERIIKKEAARHSISEDEYTLNLLEKISSKRVNDTIWKPIRKNL